MEKEKCKHLQDEEKISQEVEPYHKGGYAINGCCGGGCYVIKGIKFCPFCGEELEPHKILKLDSMGRHIDLKERVEIMSKFL